VQGPDPVLEKNSISSVQNASGQMCKTLASIMTLEDEAMDWGQMDDILMYHLLCKRNHMTIFFLEKLEKRIVNLLTKKK
jgi:hypothetical protein